MLQDIAILTGGQAISEDLGIKLDDITLNMRDRPQVALLACAPDRAQFRGGRVGDRRQDPGEGYIRLWLRCTQSGEYGNMVTKGIIDPTKVVRAALQGAASVAGLLITTEAMVAELPKKNAAPAMPGGGGMDY